MNLSNNTTKALVRVTFISTLTALAILSGSVMAQEKGAERLLNLQRTSQPSVVSATKHGAMPCPKCKDVAILTSDAMAKGGEALNTAGRPTKAVTQHQCNSCATILKTTGQGKASQTATQHSCTAPGMSTKSCCRTDAQ